MPAKREYNPELDLRNNNFAEPLNLEPERYLKVANKLRHASRHRPRTNVIISWQDHPGNDDITAKDIALRYRGSNNTSFSHGRIINYKNPRHNVKTTIKLSIDESYFSPEEIADAVLKALKGLEDKYNEEFGDVKPQNSKYRGENPWFMEPGTGEKQQG